MGSWWNVTIEKIYQGSYMAISNALIVNATMGSYQKGPNSYSYINEPFWLVYNKSLNFMEAESLNIIPIPVNLTFVANIWELKTGHECTVEGNTIIHNWTGTLLKYTYNSHGIATLLISEINDTKYLEYSLVSAGGKEIPYGNYYIVVGVVSVAIISIFLKKRFKVK